MTATTAQVFTGQVFIGGRFRPAANRVSVVEAATGAPIGDGASAERTEIDDAVAAAHSPEANAWRASPAAQRAEALTRFAAALRTRAAGAAEWRPGCPTVF
jgi:aldehyde dehydrogenase (NAD+)